MAPRIDHCSTEVRLIVEPDSRPGLHQTQSPFGRTFQKLFRAPEALIEAHGSVGDAVDARDAVLVQLLEAASQAPGQQDGGNIRSLQGSDGEL
jgi:hypothetical protein